MTEERKTVEAKLSDALDAFTTAALHETLEFLEQKSSEFQKSCTIALSAMAMYALSRPAIRQKFALMVAERILQRYPRQKKLVLKRAESERPRLTLIRGPVNLLGFEIDHAA